MKPIRKPWQVYAFWIVLTQGVGLISGLITRQALPAYDSVRKPPLTPPDAVFPIVWGILFLLMGIGIARVVLKADPAQKRLSVGIYLVQLLFNFCWSIFFFTLQAFGFSFFWLLALWLLILAMILVFRQVDPVAAWLQVPYLLWVTFAGYLNAMIWVLNR